MIGEEVSLGSRKYSRGEISRGTGLSLSHVSRIYSGRRSPSLSTIRKIAEFAGLEVIEVINSFPEYVGGE